MNLTLTETELVEDDTTGNTRELLHFDGTGCVFDANGQPFEFATFTLRLDRDADPRCDNRAGLDGRGSAGPRRLLPRRTRALVANC